MSSVREQKQRSSTVEKRPATVVSPAVNHVIEVLVERIYSGAYRGGRMMPSERALADEFGISRITVRQAVEELERRSLIVRSARCRPIVRPLEEAITGNDSSENTGGSTSVARRSVAVWLWPGADAPGISTILRGIRRALPADDFRIILECPTGDSREHFEEPEQQFLRRIISDADVEGVILWYLGGEDNLPALLATREAGLPLVFLDREPPEGFDSDYVGVDNTESAAALVTYLIEQGHRKILHITNRERVSTVAERREGYRRALERAGIPYRPEWVLRFEGPAPNDPMRGERQLAEAIAALRESGGDCPSAVFVVNDDTALRLVAALRERDIRVPEDIAVAGFDGIERWMAGTPFLTTICQPYERLGIRAAETLLERLRVGQSRPYRHVVLEGSLSTGGSTIANNAIARNGAQTV